MKRIAFLLVAFACLLGCSDDYTVEDNDSIESSNGTSAGNEEQRPYFEGNHYILDNAYANIVRKITFITNEEGIADGFNLDARVSEEDDLESCGHADLASPSGEPGIDNQLAKIWPAIQPLVGEQVEALLQGAINEGNILIMLELVGLDDFKNDDNVSINVFRVKLDPDIGTRGVISPDQTFYIDYAHPISTVENIKLVNGEMLVSPVALKLPIDILDAKFNLDMPNGQLRIFINDDGTFQGHIGGAFDVASVLNELYDTGARSEAMLVGPVFESNADMGFQGELCTHFSVAFGFESTTAFAIHDADQEP